MSLKKQAISGVKWNFVQQFSVQIINFVVQVILARLLMPEMFGLIAMVIIFISIGRALMDGGMTSSLIRTKNPDQLDYSTVFVTNIIVSFIIYGVVYFSAPYIADFYNQNILTDIVRLFALTFVIQALVAVHVAKLTKEMNFKLQMKLEIPATIISAIVGVTMAYKGYGVWSLVWLNLIRAIAFTVQYWLFVDWRPSLVFDKNRFKYHFHFGYKLTLSSLLNTIYNDAYRIVIGRFFSPASVGFFNQAETMRLFPVNQISSVVGKVTYPLFSKINDDLALKSVYRTTMKLILLCVVPVMLSLILVAEEGFRFVFGEKWLPAVPYFQILALASIVRPVSSYNLNILKVKGRSDLFLKLEIAKKSLGVIAILIGLPFQVIGLVIASTVFFYITVIIDMHYSGRLILYSMKEQVKDIYHLFVIGGLVFLILYPIKFYYQSYLKYDFLIASVFSTTFIIIYLLVLLAFDKNLYQTLKSIIHKN
ncbi:lipopolysaccharide biosynthesis protein [Psychrobacter sp. van23A]|uniref:lipopolysaccharide biosynthesis protein n=1 Tax=Psychrobacter sp. van23A TaxID=3064892 RepID=UPI0027B8B8A4|nr:lipopolysaccharide biosynthesis protein [Psychrobacter sp. van23A]WLW67011.1 lipopolysaccharide biosynthesis protein [Psychrobacter sp. van23A]